MAVRGPDRVAVSGARLGASELWKAPSYINRDFLAARNLTGAGLGPASGRGTRSEGRHRYSRCRVGHPRRSEDMALRPKACARLPRGRVRDRGCVRLDRNGEDASSARSRQGRALRALRRDSASVETHSLSGPIRRRRIEFNVSSARSFASALRGRSP